MRLNVSITLVILFLSVQLCNGQKYLFDHQKIINISEATDTTYFLYTTALWCRPCLEKMPTLDAYFEKTKLKIKIIYLFDNDGFSLAKAKKIFPHIDFTNKFLVIDPSLNPNGLIQINPVRKTFKNLAKQITSSNTNTEGLENLSVSGFMIFHPSKKIVFRDCPEVVGLKLVELEQAFSELLK